MVLICDFVEAEEVERSCTVNLLCDLCFQCSFGSIDARHIGGFGRGGGAGGGAGDDGADDAAIVDGLHRFDIRVRPFCRLLGKGAIARHQVDDLSCDDASASRFLHVVERQHVPVVLLRGHGCSCIAH